MIAHNEGVLGKLGALDAQRIVVDAALALGADAANPCTGSEEIKAVYDTERQAFIDDAQAAIGGLNSVKDSLQALCAQKGTCDGELASTVVAIRLPHKVA